MTAEERVSCDWCGREFATIHGLKIHCVKVHALDMELAKDGFEPALSLHREVRS